jgi:hypothetical protein
MIWIVITLGLAIVFELALLVYQLGELTEAVR